MIDKLHRQTVLAAKALRKELTPEEERELQELIAAIEQAMAPASPVGKSVGVELVIMTLAEFERWAADEQAAMAASPDQERLEILQFNLEQVQRQAAKGATTVATLMRITKTADDRLRSIEARMDQLFELLAARKNEGTAPPAGDPPAVTPPAGDPPAGDPPVAPPGGSPPVPPAPDPPAGSPDPADGGDGDIGEEPTNEDGTVTKWGTDLAPRSPRAR